MKPEELKAGYERVFTVSDYYDGPRKGIANFHGQPHFYECIYYAAKEEYSDLFRLTPLDAETFRLAMEDWSIWKRWEDAYRAGKVDIGTHPALPHEALRHGELERILAVRLGTDPQKAFTKVGQFEAIGRTNLFKGVFRPMQVKWDETLTESPLTHSPR